jgi:hypothetical protein
VHQSVAHIYEYPDGVYKVRHVPYGWFTHHRCDGDVPSWSRIWGLDEWDKAVRAADRHVRYECGKAAAGRWLMSGIGSPIEESPRSVLWPTSERERQAWLRLRHDRL